MKHILLPTDFSDNSFHAIQYALQLFKTTPCKFYLLHTYTPIIYNMEYMQATAAQFELLKTVENASLEGLERFKKKMESANTNPEHEVEIISSFNTLSQEVKNVVVKNKIDLVIMGTQGATGAKEVLFGSNAVHVFKNANCPVLAIPMPANYHEPKIVLFPTDYGVDYSRCELDVLTDFSKMFDSTYHVLHVSFGDALTEKQLKNQELLKAELNSCKYEFHDVRSEGVSSAIVSFKKNKPVDMLVMINNKHSFFENLFFTSRVEQIGFHTDLPFLVIPSKRN
ncbi:universal stress protein [Bizionia sp. KMM 8389]